MVLKQSSSLPHRFIQQPLSSMTSCLTPSLNRPCVVALGVFDGVHRGHQKVLQGALQEARTKGWDSLVFSFWNHPQTLLKQAPKPLLTLPEERLEMFHHLGFTHVCMPIFDASLQALSAETFLETYLLQACRMQSLWVGQNFCFGAARQGTVAFLEATALTHARTPTKGYPPWQVHAPALLCDVSEETTPTPAITEAVGVPPEVICSTRIREALQQEGDLTTVTRFLGRPYVVSGRVIHGAKRGRRLGFPTANLAVSPEKCLPATGVYAVSVYREATQQWYLGACNVGYLPTIVQQKERSSTVKPCTMNLSIEVHLLDFPPEELLYEETLTLHWHQKLRDEQKFESLEALVHQIQHDVEAVRCLNHTLPHTCSSEVF
jgi:riboflavin kinase/FMN adenylyltransferase